MSDLTHPYKCCATCKHWDQVLFEEADHFGVCDLVPETDKLRTFGGGKYAIDCALTTDLTLCSKWEQQDDE